MLLLVGLIFVLPARADGIDVRIVSDKDQYVWGEPVQISVVLRNDSGAGIRFPHLFLLDPEYMNFMFYEVVGPDGVMRRLKLVRVTQYSVWNSEYIGVPLADGDGVHLYLYPNLSNVEVNIDGSETGMDWSKTFPTPGKYQFRVVYRARGDLEELLQGEWPSNQIELRMIAPSRDEREILETLWSCLPEGEGGVDWSPSELSRLRTLLARYPDSHLRAHVQFGLARGLLSESGDEEADSEAKRSESWFLLDDLVGRQPTFRSHEVQRLRAEVLFAAGEVDDGSNVLLDAMQREPALWTNPTYIASLRIPGVERRAMFQQWYRVEQQEGIKVMTRSQFMARFSIDSE
jgi:hypothetical protein